MEDEVTRGCPPSNRQAGDAAARASRAPPVLSAAARQVLAERIAVMDGITPGEALRQIVAMLLYDLN